MNTNTAQRRCGSFSSEITIGFFGSTVLFLYLKPSGVFLLERSYGAKGRGKCRAAKSSSSLTQTFHTTIRSVKARLGRKISEQEFHLAE